MSLFSTDDIGVIIVFILPGYLALKIYEKLSISDSFDNDLDKIIWSIVFSTIIYIPYVYLNNIKTIEDVKTNIFIYRNFLTVILYAIILGAFIGIVVRHLYRQNIIEGKAWNYFFEKMPEEGAWIAITTKQGKEYLGKIWKSSRISSKSQRGSLIVNNPKLITRDDLGVVIFSQDLGDSIIILGTEIASIANAMKKNQEEPENNSSVE